MEERRQQEDRRRDEGAPPAGEERRRGHRRHDDLPGRRGLGLYLQSGAAAVLGVVVGLALSREEPPPPPTPTVAPAAAPAPARRAPDHADVVALRRTLEGLTPTDLLLDADVAARWLLVSEGLPARLEAEGHAETRKELLEVESRLRSLGVTKSPTL